MNSYKRVTINWSGRYSEFESNTDALIRMYNDPKMLAENGSWRAFLAFLAGRFGISRMAINKKLGRLRKEGKVGYLFRSDTGETQKLITIDKKLADDESPQKFLKFIIEGTRLINERDVRQEEVYPEYNTAGWVGLLVGGDFHIEHYKTDIEEVIRMMKVIGQEPNLLFGFNGDFGDFIDIRFVDLENETINIPLRRRYEVIKYMFSLVPNTLFVVCGDHENFVRTRARYDIMEEIQKEIMGYYLGFGGTVNLKVGSIVYRIGVRHRYRFESALNVFHPCTKYLQQMDGEADIVCVAHRHDTVGIAQTYYLGKPKIFIRSGSHQYKTDYAMKIGFRGAIAKYPLLLLSGTSKKMIAIHDYEDGLPILRMLNKYPEFEKELLGESGE